VSAIPFVTLDDPRYGQVVQVAPNVRRVIANNPSKFTYHGTGTYLIGSGDHVVVIDPGPDLPSHQQALEAALHGEQVTAILVTHCHSDHSPSAAWLKEITGAPTVAFGPHRVDPNWVEDDTPDELDEEELAEAAAAQALGGVRGDAPGEAPGASKVEETLDLAFTPDVHVVDGDIAAHGEGWTLVAVHTPGHTSNHMCFLMPEQRALFSGDHIMGWSTTVIAPPDGDMRAYFASLEHVRALDPATLWPTHGSPVTDVAPFIDAFVAHRLDREAQVLAAVRDGVALVPDMVRRLYAGVNEKLYKAAGRSVLAHLIKLADDGLVTFAGAQPGVTTPYTAV
jgi:glyoxylase-like metal-dependent hydrolase (beta-lactamase superfamily II)